MGTACARRGKRNATRAQHPLPSPTVQGTRRARVGVGATSPAQGTTKAMRNAKKGAVHPRESPVDPKNTRKQTQAPRLPTVGSTLSLCQPKGHGAHMSQWGQVMPASAEEYARTPKKTQFAAQKVRRKLARKYG